jgi:hypothetical protein
MGWVTDPFDRIVRGQRFRITHSSGDWDVVIAWFAVVF